MSNLQEYLADTNPTNSASRLAIVSIVPRTNGAALAWLGGSNAWQVIECRSNLADTNSWTAIYTNAPQSRSDNAAVSVNSGAHTGLFYRLKAWR